MTDNIQSGKARVFLVSLFSAEGNANPVHVVEEVHVGFEDIPSLVLRGPYSFIQFKGRYRLQENFLRAACVALDIDDGLLLSAAIERLKTFKLKCFVSLTRHHQKPKAKQSGTILPACDRYRIVVALSANVENEPDHRATVEALRQLFVVRAVPWRA